METPPTLRTRAQSRGLRGTTLLELLVATSIFLIVLVSLLQVLGSIGNVWKSSQGKLSTFESSRSAFSSLRRQISQATLHSYHDYVDVNGQYRNSNNPGTFSPVDFARASELHFVSGPITELAPGATPDVNPGHGVFFQAPLGVTDDPTLASLNRSLNTLGFYIEYGEAQDTLLPNWLQSRFATERRYRLLQFVRPAESNEIYTSTAGANYSLDWLTPMLPGTATGAQVLAEDVVLLVILPRVSPAQEAAIAPDLGTIYTEETDGSILSPNFHYDSRAWQNGYPTTRVKAADSPTERAAIMRNQLPPIVELAMVSVDPATLKRHQGEGGPPSVLAVPAGAFINSALLDQDLAAYSQQLSDAGVRHRVFSTSVEIQSSRWSNTSF